MDANHSHSMRKSGGSFLCRTSQVRQGRYAIAFSSETAAEATDDEGRKGATALTHKIWFGGHYLRSIIMSTLVVSDRLVLV